MCEVAVDACGVGESVTRALFTRGQYVQNWVFVGIYTIDINATLTDSY